MAKNTFTPEWSETPPGEGTYRSIFKWGDPQVFKHPNRRLYEYLKAALQLGDEDFKEPRETGGESVRLADPPALPEPVLDALREIAGEENVRTDDSTRARHAYGKSMYDLLRLRKGLVENPPDAVISPRNAEDVRQIVALCSSERIPVTVYGGGSSVTRGVEPMRGGISLDMRTHMNRILQLNPENQTVRVEPGISGPELEEALNRAKERFGAPHNYTCGHFPQSFEYSTVGGWVVTRGAGQNSTYYGKIEDLVIAQKYVTPAGEIATMEVPAQATGPDLDQILIGSEGAYGILVEVTLRVFRHRPEGRRYFSYMFHDWDSAVEACREVMQGEFGSPSVFRLSDPEETDVALRLYGISGSVLDRFLTARGYEPKRRCLLLGTVDGDPDYARLVHRKIKKVCREHRAFYTTGIAAKRWEHGRFSDPYLREDLGDYGIVIDTLECAVSWSNLRRVWAAVRETCHSRPNTICMVHSSHFYPQGTNLYFIFIAKMDGIEDYARYQAAILDTIQKKEATMSHHHGIGKMIAPWLEKQIGKNELGVFRALKEHFDPDHILNPGGTLGLDQSPEKDPVTEKDRAVEK